MNETFNRANKLAIVLVISSAVHLHLSLIQAGGKRGDSPIQWTLYSRLLWGDLHAHVTTCHHDGISLLQDLVVVLDTLLVLDFGDDL